MLVVRFGGLLMLVVWIGDVDCVVMLAGGFGGLMFRCLFVRIVACLCGIAGFACLFGCVVLWCFILKCWVWFVCLVFGC